MNVILNYLLETNLSLAFFLLVYVVFLRTETNFRLKRMFLLFSILASAVFAMLHFNFSGNGIPALRDFVPPTWLPEVVVTANGTATQPTTTQTSTWLIVAYVYGIGVFVSLLVFFIRLVSLLRLISKSTFSRYGKYWIVESTENKSSFSFFRFIFIGQTNRLTTDEKQQIIDHECVHIQELHSIDILLLNLLGIFFWFNPVIILYKKILIQLHEFEADARAVENRDMNDYCSLLAKVALLSADFSLANHFSNSLTVKRIEMMRTIKSKIRGWKILVLLVLIPAFFVVISCQDQVMQDVQEVAKNSTMAIDIPEEVQLKIEELKTANPEREFIVLEVDQADSEKAEAAKTTLSQINPEEINSINVLKNKTDKYGNKRSFIIIEKRERTNLMLEQVTEEGDVFTVVEESATPVGGMEQLGSFIRENLRYPEESRKAGLEGKVFIQFVVNTDGSLSDFTPLKGVDPAMDAEALRVAKLFPNWNPGKQKGKAVRQRFVMPILFKLND